MALTKRQKQVLDFIAGFVAENRYCPSYEEIARGLQLASLATVHKHISILETKNYLKRGFNQSRSLELTAKYMAEVERSKPQSEIPLRGRPPWRRWNRARRSTSPNMWAAAPAPTRWKCAAIP
jgi:repressor LexA